MWAVVATRGLPPRMRPVLPLRRLRVQHRGAAQNSRGTKEPASVLTGGAQQPNAPPPELLLLCAAGSPDGRGPPLYCPFSGSAPYLWRGFTMTSRMSGARARRPGSGPPLWSTVLGPAGAPSCTPTVSASSTARAAKCCCGAWAWAAGCSRKATCWASRRSTPRFRSGANHGPRRKGGGRSGSTSCGGRTT